MKITFLGTTCMVPTKNRNANAIFIEHKNKGLLFDCGEGTQRQMNITKIKRSKINYIFITHWHGDHIGGLLPLLMTLSNIENQNPIKLFGPKDTKEKFNHLRKSSYFDSSLEIEVHEINTNKIKTILDNEEFYVQAINMTHAVPCIAYNVIEKDQIKINMKEANSLGIKEGPNIGKLLKNKEIKINNKIIKLEDISTIKKGKKITMILDTSLNENMITLAKNSDILICESTYHSSLAEKAEDYSHLTSKDAGMIARQNNVKELYLTHFSQRYKDVDELVEEAKIYFPNTKEAKDFMSIKL